MTANSESKSAIFLEREIERYRNCDPLSMSKMSQAAIFYAFEDGKKDILTIHAELSAALRRVQELERDAARYRYMRNLTTSQPGPFICRAAQGIFSMWNGEHADEAIDAAISASKKEGE